MAVEISGNSFGFPTKRARFMPKILRKSKGMA